MGKEIERKFLINLHQLGPLPNGTVIQQAYIATADHTAVRVRVAGEDAFLTLKGKNQGNTRSEFEYRIPLEDAQDMMAELCSGPKIDKTRYVLIYAGHTWEIDVFHGDNDGLVVAEIELGGEDESFTLPPWVTEEVSGDAKYFNSCLLHHPFKEW